MPELIFACAFPFFVLFCMIYCRYIIAIFAIIFGDKESLKDVGNLCDTELPWESYSTKVGDKEGDSQQSLYKSQIGAIIQLRIEGGN